MPVGNHHLECRREREQSKGDHKEHSTHVESPSLGATPPPCTRLAAAGDLSGASRCERRSRYHLDVFVQREIQHLVQDSFMPLLLQVVITWTAFFISIKQLMPRVAVAFMHAAAPQPPKVAPFAHTPVAQ